MIRSTTVVLFVLIGTFFQLHCQGQNTIQLLNDETLTAEQLDSFLSEQMEELNMPGLSIAIVNNGSVVYHRTLGVKNAQSGELIDKQTAFEAASITKSVFAYYIMRMVDEGVIDLDTPLHEYLPNYDLDHDPRYTSITARLILTHQSGLPQLAL